MEIGKLHSEAHSSPGWQPDYDAAVGEVQQILSDSMQELTPDVPIETEYLLADRWYKDVDEQPRGELGEIVPYVRDQPLDPAQSATPVEPTHGVPATHSSSVQHAMPVLGAQPHGRPSLASDRITSLGLNSSQQHDAQTDKRPTSGNRRDLRPAYQLDNPRTEVYIGECRAILRDLDVRPDLIFADPPFNIGEQYGTWNDNLPWAAYWDFTYAWLDLCVSILSPRGSIWVHVPDEIAAEVVIHLKSRGLIQINWCLWHYRFGQCQDLAFIKSKCHGLYFARDRKNRIWNPDAVRVPSDRATKYADKRTQHTKTPGKRVPFDIFGLADDGKNWGRVQGNNGERRSSHENQLPEVYLARVIKALTNEGDLILDPFAGSGTTATVALALGRQSITIEIDPENAKSAFDRIKEGPVRDVVNLWNYDKE